MGALVAMTYNELRKDYLLNRWVVIATERGRRPTDFAKPKTESAQNTICPLCAGNEHLTPPAVLVYLKSDSEIVKDKDTESLRHKNWLIRSVPNLYPAFAPPKNQTITEAIMKNPSYGFAVGHHEVLVESPNHDEDPADAELSQLVLVIKAYIDRLSDLGGKPYVRYVSIFRNYGKEAGASLSHAHSQIIATPVTPRTVEEEMLASSDYWNEHGKCAFCDILKREAEGPRQVQENSNFVVFTPYASLSPMEFWIVPKRHNSNLFNLSKTEIESFAETLKTSLRGLKDLVNDPPYNYGIHLSLDEKARDYYHWHLEVYPQLSIWAGFEKNTGMHINTVRPETAAAELKRIIKF
jgi:UDPglucose--hexose-1-phosphate uridylyltransferase